MNERPFEYSFVFDMIKTKAPETLLDVGTGKTAFTHLVNTCNVSAWGIDSDKKQIKKNTACKVKHDDILAPKTTGKYDMVTCISVLEHIHEYDLAVKNMAALLNPKGWLVMTFPFDQTHRVLYKTRKAFCQTFCDADIERWGSNIDFLQYKHIEWKDHFIAGVCFEKI